MYILQGSQGNPGHQGKRGEDGQQVSNENFYFTLIFPAGLIYAFSQTMDPRQHIHMPTYKRPDPTLKSHIYL